MARWLCPRNIWVFYPSTSSFLLPQSTKATVHFGLGIIFFLIEEICHFGKFSFKKKQTQLGDINMPLISPHFLAYRSN